MNCILKNLVVTDYLFGNVYNLFNRPKYQSMRYNLIVCVAYVVLTTCNDKAKQTKATETRQQQPEIASNTQTNQTSEDGITGYWKLKLEAYDDNSNKILDEAERKKGIQNRYLFRFNVDGSCQIQEVYKGRYEVKTESNKKMLYVYRNRIVGEEEKDPPPDVYRIISLNKKELVLLEDLGNLAFWVFERVS